MSILRQNLLNSRNIGFMQRMLPLRNSDRVLWSGVSLPVSHMTSTLTLHSRSIRLEDLAP